MNMPLSSLLCLIYILGVLATSRYALTYYMRSTVWHCLYGDTPERCQRFKAMEDTWTEHHRRCPGLVERGEVEPRDGSAVAYAVLSALVWPAWAICIGVSSWIRSAPLTPAERLRLLREQEERLHEQKQEIDRLEKKVLAHENKKYVERREFSIDPPRPEPSTKRPTPPPPDTGKPKEK